jgi:single-strand DNA-binding protein
MAGMCKAALIGYLGRDPESKTTPDGLAITNFSLAATEKVKGEDKTEWVRVTAFGKLAEICSQYLSKGKQVYIEGRLETSEWQDKENNKRFTVGVIASNMVMLGSKNDAPKQTAQNAYEDYKKTLPDDAQGATGELPSAGGVQKSDGEDIPF